MDIPLTALSTHLNIHSDLRSFLYWELWVPFCWMLWSLSLFHSFKYPDPCTDFILRHISCWICLCPPFSCIVSRLQNDWGIKDSNGQTVDHVVNPNFGSLTFWQLEYCWPANITYKLLFWGAMLIDCSSSMPRSGIPSRDHPWNWLFCCGWLSTATEANLNHSWIHS